VPTRLTTLIISLAWDRIKTCIYVRSLLYLLTLSARPIPRSRPHKEAPIPPQTQWPPTKPTDTAGRTALDVAVSSDTTGLPGLKAQVARAAGVQPTQLSLALKGGRPLTNAQYLAIGRYFTRAKGIPWANGPFFLMDRSRLSGCGIAVEHVGGDRPDLATFIAVHLAAIPTDERTPETVLAAVHAAHYAFREEWHGWPAGSPAIVAASIAELAQAMGYLHLAHAAKTAEKCVQLLIATHKPSTWAELRTLFETAIDRFEHPQNRQRAQEIDP
jgi:hypothetical protein